MLLKAVRETRAAFCLWQASGDFSRHLNVCKVGQYL